MRNFSPSCERNKDAICMVLQEMLSLGSPQPSYHNILEIGSLSGQHAIHFCQKLDNVIWQTSDMPENKHALEINIMESQLDHCLLPIELNVAESSHWPERKYDVIYSANTLHIMSWQHVEALFTHLSRVVNNGSLLCIYGPFKYQGRYTSSSNESFEQWLKDRDEHSGIRDFELVNSLAQAQGFQLISDKKMPANNQFITWKFARNNN